jgi:peptide/nickel transport system ATP-binding protein/oligopeptide transport system ATP-binding protein
VTETLLRVRNLTVRFPMPRRGLVGPRPWLTAVNGVNLEIEAGCAVGLVGESGCGKSTVARAILALVVPQAGTIEWRGQPVRYDDATGLRRMRRELQVVFQDPVGSLDPRMSVGESVTEALEALEGAQAAAATRARVGSMLSDVGLDPALHARYPHELSGGQCQRVAIARALVGRPKLLVCDEAVSALDVSVQAQIVNLLSDLRQRHGLALLFISHNLAVVRHLCDEVAVLYRGRIVERAASAAIFAAPRHPYTRALLAAVPDPDPATLARLTAPELRAALAVESAAGTGCAYQPRCPLADSDCRVEAPGLEDDGGGHLTACHRARVLVSESTGLPSWAGGR